MASYTKTENGWRVRVRKNGASISKSFPTKAMAQAWALREESDLSAVQAEGIHDKDGAKSAQARSMLDEWNAKNPEAKIKIDRAAVLRRAKQMAMTAQERFVKTSPKEMRQQVREAFTEK